MKKIGVIGGIVAEIEGNPYGQLLDHDLNEGTISMSFSGGGRNAAENLARMGEKAVFVSAVGDDFSGRGAVRELERLGVDAGNVELMPGKNTAAYLSVLNIVGDLEVALGNMDIYQSISKEIIDNSASALKECAIIGIDGNISEEALAYAVEKFKGTPLFLDPAAKASAERAKNLIGNFHTIKPDRGEAEALTGLTIMSEEELEAAGKWFIEKGVKRVFITLGGGGVYYADETDAGFVRPVDMKDGIVKAILNPKGGGDAFSAAILSGFVQGYDVRTTAEYGMASAKLALDAKEAVNPQLTKELLSKVYEEMFGRGSN